MLPALPLLGFSPDWGSLAAPEMWGGNLCVFWGWARARWCFVTWNMACEGALPGEDEPVHLPRAGAHRAGLGRRAGRPAHPAGRRRSPAYYSRAVPFRAREVARYEAAHASESNVGGEKASDSEVRKGFEGAAQAAFPHSARSQKGSRGIAPVHPREARGFLPNSICFLHYTSNRLHGDARDWAASSEGFHRTSFVEWKTRTDVSRETSTRRDAEGCRLRRRSGVVALAASKLSPAQRSGRAVSRTAPRSSSGS